MKIFFLYSAFTLASIIANIGAQMLFLLFYSGVFAVEASIVFGTAIGMPLRFLLEKHFVFSFRSRNLRQEGQIFVLYTGMSVITTLIFWTTEYAFHVLYGSDAMRYTGAVLGLILGSWAKYLLDRQFVFVHPEGDRR
jgi:putative flippase GtrA